jgi:hypothetical protein
MEKMHKGHVGQLENSSQQEENFNYQLLFQRQQSDGEWLCNVL